ncbi:mannose-1-phosphate guanyltransferase [Candidatus Magnetomorum sp. HK-1]|nr:mannose-1-phosphate guanyltransferase [Candidatus Magnetomorum sp. HK-1]
MPHKTKAFSLLLAGGSGTRLWPVSRDMFPKQLVRFIDNQSLIQHTLNRLLPAFDPENMSIICGNTHELDIKQDAKEINLVHDHLIINEPCGRNTAPAILLGALQIYEKNPEASVFIFPADHVVGRLDKLYEKIKEADQLAQENYIVTFGITPEYPETGYGYIEASDQKIGAGNKIKRFVEKPNIENAKKYIGAGNFYWNAGMFAFKARILIEAFQKYMPDMLESLKTMIDNDHMDYDHYQSLENISFDYAIMEKTDAGVVLPSDFQWSDIGSWKSLYETMPKDNDNNVAISEDLILQNVKDCLVMGDKRLIVLNQLKNIAVIDTPDALFVSDLEHSRDVKNAVTLLKKNDRKEYKFHINQATDWGDIQILDDQTDCVVSKISIHKGASIPKYKNDLQIKKWHVTYGYGVVTVDNVSVQVHAGEDITIENGMTVSFKNLSKDRLFFIEIATLVKSIPSDLFF